MKLKGKKLLKPRQDNDLLFLVLMSGGSLSDYHDMRDNPLDSTEDIKPPTEDDILASWILGKDEEMNQYKCGGHLKDYGGLNSNNYRDQFGGTYSNPNFGSGTNDGSALNNGSSSADSSGRSNFIGNALQTLGYILMFDTAGSNIFDMMNRNNMNDPSYKYIAGDSSRGFWGRMLNVDSDFLNGINDLKNQNLMNYAVSDNAGLMQQYNMTPLALHSNVDTDRMSLASWIVDPSHILWRDRYDERKQAWNGVVDQINALNEAGFNTAVVNSQRLGIYNQLSQPYMAACGGKMKHRYDIGGYINSHFDNFNDDLIKIQSGGTHQENPNQGVLVSVAPDGQPNLVEEGETIKEFEDGGYVFSDRIVADAEILKNHLINEKLAGKTYADISKELDKIIAEHKFDEASHRTFEEMTKRLQESQEDQKFQEKQKEVEQFVDSLSDEQKQALEEEMVAEAEQEAEALAQAEQAAQELAIQEQQPTPEEQADMEEQAAMQSQEMPLQGYSPYDEVMSRALITDAANQGLFGNGGHVFQYAGTARYENPVTPEMRRYAAEERQRNIEAAHSQGQPYYEEVPVGIAEEFLSGRKLRQINPDGTETIIDNAYIDKNGTPVFLLTGIAPAPSSTRPAAIPKSAVGKTNDIKNAIEVGKKAKQAREIKEFEEMYKESGVGERAIEELKRLSNANDIASKTKFSTKARNATKIVNDSKNANKLNWFQKTMIGLGAGNTIAWPITIAGFNSINDEEDSNIDSNRKVDRNMMKNSPDFMSIDRYLTTPQSYYDSAYRDFMTGHKRQPGGPLYNSRNVILMLQKTPYTPISLDSQYESWKDYVDNMFVTPPSWYRLYVDKDRDNSENEEIIVKNPSSVGISNYRNNNINDAVTSGSLVTYEQEPIVEQKTEYSNPHIPDYSIFGQYIPGLTPEEVNGNVIGYRDPFGKFVPIGGETTYSYTPTNASTTTTSTTAGSEDTKPERNPGRSSEGLSTWLRYAPAIGSGLQALSDAFGITNKNDYTNPNMFQRSINAIPNVGFVPIGGYRTFNPLDTLTASNINSSATEAARRTAINNSNGNASAALAALDAMNQQENNALGNLYIQAQQYNNLMEHQIALHNLRINQINASMSMTAQEKNQAIAAEKAKLNYNLAQMRQQIENANDVAKSLNYTNLMTNLGNIGRENFIMNQVNSNMGLYYGVDRNGNAYYKSAYNDLSDEEKKVVDDYIKNEGLTIKKK